MTEPPKPTDNWRYARLLSIITAIFLWTAHKLYSEQTADWASLPSGITFNVKQEILKSIVSVTDGDTVKAGSNIKLLTLRTARRNYVSLYLAEGEFTGSGIDGIDKWQRLLNGGAILINPVDELHRNNGGISRQIATGCNLTPLRNNEKPHQIGDVTFEECNGSYRNHSILKIANIAIVVWNDVSGRNKCKERQPDIDSHFLSDNYSINANYISCIIGWTGYALNDLFTRRISEADLPAVVIPAIGTGTGNVPPEPIYQTYRKVIEELLTNPETSSQLPDRIVLLVWRKWPAERWINHQMAIANLISELYNKWIIKAEKYRNPAPIANLLGVLLGMLMITIGASLRVTLIPSSLHGISEKQLAQTLIGWGLAALGFVTVFQNILMIPLASTWYISFALGMISVLLAINIERSKSVSRRKRT